MCLGIPGRIVEMHDTQGLPMGVVDFGGVRREVCLAYVKDEIKPGDYAIVHVGFAISKVDETEAKRTFEVLREMSQLDELDWMKDLLP
ncbi:MAG TPA: HypC/HybG/HupF family hydrogenase formation chaperone [Gemmatimonadales bacterium]|jgi:hydrogenase expression/formation protein HypC|nr:HypC/HybG/HupF family hydrogenase formation chaperone [Gemmatimonadales bacterium]